MCEGGTARWLKDVIGEAEAIHGKMQSGKGPWPEGVQNNCQDLYEKVGEPGGLLEPACAGVRDPHLTCPGEESLGSGKGLRSGVGVEVAATRFEWTALSWCGKGWRARVTHGNHEDTAVEPTEARVCVHHTPDV